jgi:undecaprenyl diphosphate synthase
MEKLKEKIDLERLPKHIAIIMDGNGRWAKKQGAKRIFGHQNAIKAVREVTEASAELGIKYLTLYAFSTENWGRPEKEVQSLMELLVATIRKETSTLIKNNVRLAAIGNIKSLPEDCQIELQEAIDITNQNDGLTLILALSYSGRWEIIEAIRKLLKDVKIGDLSEQNINSQLFSSYLSTAGIPDPELLIRTSGEKRISNFLLWQIAYTELYITDVLWPDVRKEDLYEAIVDYQSRERRFGKISEQVKI